MVALAEHCPSICIETFDLRNVPNGATIEREWGEANLLIYLFGCPDITDTTVQRWTERIWRKCVQVDGVGELKKCLYRLDCFFLADGGTVVTMEVVLVGARLVADAFPVHVARLCPFATVSQRVVRKGHAFVLRIFQ